MIRRITDQLLARIIDLKVRQGLTNVVIAERLGISQTTIKTYMRRYRELNYASTASEAEHLSSESRCTAAFEVC